jgi:DNA-binding MarR family transcriptional regulator
MSTPDLSPGKPVKTTDMLIGALLRVPARAIQLRIISDLNAAGFKELRMPHMAVFQFPGPNGDRPSVLAERAGMSKQAMNQLLGNLEVYGYVERLRVPGEERARAVHLTARGRAVYMKSLDILRQIEAEWTVELGIKDLATLKRLLFRVWDSPLIRPHMPDHPGAGTRG